MLVKCSECWFPLKDVELKKKKSHVFYFNLDHVQKLKTPRWNFLPPSENLKAKDDPKLKSSKLMFFFNNYISKITFLLFEKKKKGSDVFERLLLEADRL